LQNFTAVVRLSECDYFHAFHADCIECHYKSTTQKDKFYKCSVCEKISGVRVGEMPSGTMSWRFDPHLHIGGHNKNGGYSINYSIHSGNKNGVRF